MNKTLTVVSNEKLNHLKALLEKSKSTIHKSLPAHMSADRMIRIAMVAASRQPQLLQCEPLSLLRALLESSQLGLEPFTGLQQAYIIPFRNGKTGQYEAQFMPSYRGLIDLARRSGNIVSIEAHCVYDNDVFECELGLNPKLRHIPCFDGKPRGKLKLVYAVAILKDGGKQYEVMTRAEIDEIRASSKSSNSGPWVSHYDEMSKKSCVKRLAKYLPMSIELSKAITKDNAANHDDVFDVDAVDFEEEKPNFVETSASDDLVKKLENEQKDS